MALEEEEPFVVTAEFSQQDAAPEGPRLPRKKPKRRKDRRQEEEDNAGALEAGAESPEAAVERLTEAGHRALLLGRAEEALAAFQEALTLCLDTPGRSAQAACTLNLGAAYVEAGRPEEGLECLLRLQPEEMGAPEQAGDLLFNLGAAHQALQDFPRALESFRKAQDLYCSSARAGSRAGSSAVQMAHCYLAMGDPSRAGRCFAEAGRVHTKAGSLEAAAATLLRAGSLMLQSHQPGEALQLLSECCAVAERVPSRAFLRTLYHDVGLGFGQLQMFSLAIASFEKALPQSRTDWDNPQQEASLLQNLAEAHNALGHFRTALSFHQGAAWLHGVLGNRRVQGKCFGNLAYAFSQLADHEAARESYLHALQAFRDSEDLEGQWQACEGLGASLFHLGDPGKAVAYYKEALTLISRCQDGSGTAQGRIVNKLASALQCKISTAGRSFHGPWVKPLAPPAHEHDWPPLKPHHRHSSPAPSPSIISKALPPLKDSPQPRWAVPLPCRNVSSPLPVRPENEPSPRGRPSSPDSPWDPRRPFAQQSRREQPVVSQSGSAQVRRGPPEQGDAAQPRNSQSQGSDGDGPLSEEPADREPPTTLSNGCNRTCVNRGAPSHPDAFLGTAASQPNSRQSWGCHHWQTGRKREASQLRQPMPERAAAPGQGLEPHRRRRGNRVTSMTCALV